MTLTKPPIGKICIIDDCEMDQYLVNRSITQVLPNVSTKTFFTAESFIQYLDQLIEKQKIAELSDALVTMDLRMPGMGGIEALQEIQSRIDAQLITSAVFECFVLTSSNNPRDRVDIEKFKFVKGYITKPLTSETIEEILVA